MSTFDLIEFRVLLEFELRWYALVSYIRSLVESPDVRLCFVLTSCSVLVLIYITLGILVIGGAS